MAANATPLTSNPAANIRLRHTFNLSALLAIVDLPCFVKNVFISSRSMRLDTAVPDAVGRLAVEPSVMPITTFVPAQKAGKIREKQQIRKNETDPALQKGAVFGGPGPVLVQRNIGDRRWC